MSFSDKAFHPSGNTIKIAASTASTNMALAINGAAHQVSVVNGTTAYAHVVFGSSVVTSTFPTTADSAPGFILTPSSERVLTPGSATYMAASLSAGTGAVYATPGEGK